MSIRIDAADQFPCTPDADQKRLVLGCSEPCGAAGAQYRSGAQYQRWLRFFGHGYKWISSPGTT